MNINHRNKMKQILVCLLAMTLFTACDNDHDGVMNPDKEQNINPEEGISKIEFSLQTDATKRNLLDMTKISLFSEKDVTVADIREAYDKLEWIVKNKSGDAYSYSLLRENGMTFSWGHCFYAPGIYTTALIGSKGGKEVFHSNELTFRILKDKNFLGWNWNELPESSTTGQSYVNVLDPDFELTFQVLNEQGKRGIYIYRFNSKNEDEEAFNKESQDKLYRYITKLYGNAILNKDNVQLDETYLKEFSYQFKNSQPLAIWKNESSRMVLLLDRSHDFEKVIVFAEPRK